MMDLSKRANILTKNDKYSEKKQNSDTMSAVSLDDKCSEKGFLLHLSIPRFAVVDELADETSADFTLLKNHVQTEIMFILLKVHKWKQDYSIENINFSKYMYGNKIVPVATIHLKSKKFTNQRALIDTIENLVQDSNLFKVVKNKESIIPLSSHRAVVDRCYIAALMLLLFYCFLFYCSPQDSGQKNLGGPDVIVELRKLDVYCYETKGVKAVKENIERYKYVTVTGVPGSGKTTAIQHAALHLHDKFKYKIHVISDFKQLPSYITSTTEKQVFILNDPFGLYDIDWISVSSWELVQETVTNSLKNKHIKVLLSMRLSIIHNPRIQQIEIFKQSNSLVIDFNHTNYTLNLKEMVGMLRMYLPKKRETELIDGIIKLHNRQIEDYKLVNSMFPLVCKYFADGILKDVANVTSFVNHFKEIRHQNRRQFCGLMLIVLFGGKINNDDFNPVPDPYELTPSYKLRLRDVVLDEFDLKKSDLTNISKELKFLHGTYLRYDNESEITQFSHSLIFDVVTYVYDNIMFVLKFSSFDFVMNRVRIENATSKTDPYALLIKNKQEIKSLSKKLWQDLIDNPFRAGQLINYPHIDNETLISSMEKYFNEREDIANNISLINLMFNKSMLALAERRFSCFDYIDSSGTKFNLGHRFIKLLLQKKANSNMLLNKCGDRPILVAAITGNEVLAEILIENGADVHGKNCLNQSVFYFVFDIVQDAEKNANYCTTYFNSKPIRSIDVTSYIISMITLFVNKGGSINSADIYGISPLHRIMMFDYVDILPFVKTLISHGADVNAKNNAGMTPLHYLANSRIKNATHILEILVNSSCNVLDVDHENNSVLHLLFLPIPPFNDKENSSLSNNTTAGSEIVSNKLKLAEMFTQLGVKVNSTNKFGQTALHTIVIDPPCYIRSHNVKHSINLPITRYSKDKEIQILKKIIELYLEKGGDINAIDNDGNHVLHSLPCLPPEYAEEMLKFYIEHKADINIKDMDNRTVLHLMLRAKTTNQYLLQFAKLFLSKFTNINAVDKDGKSFLHYISQNNRNNAIELVRLFLNHSLDVNIVDKTNKTAQDYFLSFNSDHFLDLAKLFASYDADIRDSYQQFDDEISLQVATFETKLNVSILSFLYASWGIRVTETDCVQANYSNCRTLLYISSDDFVTLPEWILKHSIDVNATDKQLRNLLHYLAFSTSNKTVQLAEMFLNKYIDVNAVDKQGRTALHYLVISESNNTIQLAQMILKKSVDVNAVDNEGRTVLHYLIVKSSNRTIQLAQMILNKSNDSNYVYNKSKTMPHYHVVKPIDKTVQLAEMFLEFADVNVVDKNGRTALHYLVMYTSDKTIQLAQMILNKSITVNAVDKDGRTVLHYLVMYTSDKTIQLAQMILNKSINVNAVDKDGRTVLHYLVMYTSENSVQLAQMVLSRTVDVNAVDKYGRTALHYLVMYTSDKTIQLAQMILNKSINVNAVDKDGRTVLHYLVMYTSDNSVQLAQMVLSRTVDVNAVDKYGRTVLHYLVMYTSDKTIQLAQLFVKKIALHYLFFFFP